jgi:ATP phosphoribosyltransferase regulatory subunit HisZ
MKTTLSFIALAVIIGQAGIFAAIGNPFDRSVGARAGFRRALRYTAPALHGQMTLRFEVENTLTGCY